MTRRRSTYVHKTLCIIIIIITCDETAVVKSRVHKNIKGN